MVRLRNKKHLEIKHHKYNDTQTGTQTHTLVLFPTSRKNAKPLDIHQLSPLKYSIGKCDPT